MNKENTSKATILFVHTACPAQFSDLCEYLNESGLANAHYMTTPGNLKRNRSKYQNLISVTPDGNIVGATSYNYSGKVGARGAYQPRSVSTTKGGAAEIAHRPPCSTREYGFSASDL